MTNTLAQSLVQARAAQQTINVDVYPSTTDEAYLIQQVVVTETNDTISGLKIGATNEATQSILGLTQPFFGPVFKNDVFNHHADIPLSKGYPVKIETEFVIGLGKTMTGKSGSISMEEVIAAIEWVAPGFELIGSRIDNPPEHPGLCAIADGGGNHNVVLGAPDHNWQSRDWQQHTAALAINDTPVASGHSGDSIVGSPIGMLHWLLNFDRFDGQQLNAGQFVFCGTCTLPIIVNAGDTLEADFGSLGRLKAHCISD